ALPAGAQDGGASPPPSSSAPSRMSSPVAEGVPAAAPPGAAAARPVVAPPLSVPPTPVVSPSSTPPPPFDAAAPSPEEHRHLGLYVHADAGGGYLQTTGTRGGSDFASHGGALGLGLAFGWAPNDEWALALEGWVWKSTSASGLGPNTSVELQGLGLTGTRYIVSSDLFATVVVSGTRLAITEDSSSNYVEDAHSDIGFGMRIRLGKEWHVTPWLGLGVAAELFLSVNREGGQSLE